MKLRVLLLVFLVCFDGFAQNKTDSLAHYLEDQLYFIVQNNNLIDTPNGFEAYGFSNGISAGFIKDIPLNDQRNIGIGIGAGIANNTFKNNLKLTENNNSVDLSIILEGFDSNKITTKAFEVPIEFRWRTSTPDKFKFWRIYPGIKVSYLYQSEYTFLDSKVNYKIKNPDVINKWQYGLTLSAGYSAFNLYTYVGLKPLYKELVIDGHKSAIKEFKIGLIFYIL